MNSRGYWGSVLSRPLCFIYFNTNFLSRGIFFGRVSLNLTNLRYLRFPKVDPSLSPSLQGSFLMSDEFVKDKGSALDRGQTVRQDDG